MSVLALGLFHGMLASSGQKKKKRAHAWPTHPWRREVRHICLASIAVGHYACLSLAAIWSGQEVVSIWTSSLGEASTNFCGHRFASTNGAGAVPYLEVLDTCMLSVPS